MKKQGKKLTKLTLAKETVRSLDALREVRGGTTLGDSGCGSCKFCYEEPITVFG
jgi:hypothetical protein